MIKRVLPLLSILFSLVSCQCDMNKRYKPESKAAQEVENSFKSKINYGSHPIAEQYRTVITENYQELDVNFAHYYVIITWGCGSGCVSGAMVDTRDGFVYPMPEDNEWGGNGTYIESNKGSQVLLTVAVAQSSEDDIEEIRKSWLWNEDLKIFQFNKKESVITKSNE